MARIVDEYLDGRTEAEIAQKVRVDEVAASKKTALAIHAGYDRTATRDVDPLLTALSESIVAFDRHIGPSDKDS